MGGQKKPKRARKAGSNPRKVFTESNSPGSKKAPKNSKVFTDSSPKSPTPSKKPPKKSSPGKKAPKNSKVFTESSPKSPTPSKKPPKKSSPMKKAPKNSKVFTESSEAKKAPKNSKVFTESQPKPPRFDPATAQPPMKAFVEPKKTPAKTAPLFSPSPQLRGRSSRSSSSDLGSPRKRRSGTHPEGPNSREPPFPNPAKRKSASKLSTNHKSPKKRQHQRARSSGDLTFGAPLLRRSRSDDVSLKQRQKKAHKRSHSGGSARGPVFRRSKSSHTGVGREASSDEVKKASDFVLSLIAKYGLKNNVKAMVGACTLAASKAAAAERPSSRKPVSSGFSEFKKALFNGLNSTSTTTPANKPPSPKPPSPNRQALDATWESSSEEEESEEEDHAAPPPPPPNPPSPQKSPKRRVIASKLGMFGPPSPRKAAPPPEIEPPPAMEEDEYSFKSSLKMDTLTPSNVQLKDRKTRGSVPEIKLLQQPPDRRHTRPSVPDVVPPEEAQDSKDYVLEPPGKKEGSISPLLIPAKEPIVILFDAVNGGMTNGQIVPGSREEQSPEQFSRPKSSPRERHF